MDARILLVAACLLVAGCSAPTEPTVSQPPAGAAPAGPFPPHPPGMPEQARVALVQVASGLEAPVHVTHDGSSRLFVVEQSGRILVVEAGVVRAAPALDVRHLVRSGGERGLLSVAFDPERTGVAYVSYTDRAGDTVLARYAVGADGSFDPASAGVVLHVAQPYGNHNGGLALFGPDGYLYMGLGDGGLAGDPHGHGQDPHTWLGSLLRLDVRDQETYAVPEDNPFADGEAGAPEVWAFGLRNPWRFAFDAATGDLYLADVGQNRVEEVNFQSVTSRGGEDYGWNAWEGTREHTRGASSEGRVFPVVEYRIDGRAECAIVGGVVYRGNAIPDLSGVYLFGDHCSGVVWGLWHDGDEWRQRELLQTGMRISSFGEDAAGEAYVVDIGGAVHRVVAG